MKEIRLGTIGSGVIVHSMLDNVKRTDGIHLKAVYSRDGEKGRSLAAEYDCSTVYTDMEEFLGDENINTIYIATPNLLHFEQAKRALLSGKNVILEKPFCIRVSEAKELISLAKERRLFLTEAVPTAFLPNLRILKRELPKIGRVKLVISNYSQYSSRYDDVLRGELPNIFNTEYAGGCLVDINFYNIYLNAALFGKPAGAVYYPNREGKLADTSGVLVMQYEGFVSTNAGAKDTWGVNSFQIEGEQGYIYIKDGANGIAQVRTVTKESDKTYNEQSGADRLYYEVQELTGRMLADDYETVYAGLDTSLIVTEILENARKDAGLFFLGDES